MKVFKSDKWAIHIVILLLLLCVAVVLYSGAVTKRVTHFDSLWNEYNDHAIALNSALQDFSHAFGYGGFIRNFKNLVLRQDTALIPLIEENLEQSRSALQQISNSDRSKDVQQMVRQLEGVVDLYADKFELAKSLIQQGMGPAAIDELVHADDKPALVAIDLLNRHARADSLAALSQTGTHIEDSIRDSKWGMLLIPIFIVFGIVIFIFLVRLQKNHEFLQDSKRHMDELMEAIPDALLIVNEQGEIIRANLQAEKLLNYKREELLGRKVESLMPECYRHDHRQQRKRSMELQASRPMSGSGFRTFTALTRDGREIPVDINISMSRQDDQTIAITSLRDLSSWKKAEESMLLSQKIYENLTEGVLVTDHEKKIIDTNEAFSCLTGYSREELLGQTPTILHSGYQDRDFYQDMWNSINTSGHWQGEIWDRHKDGHIFPAMLSIGAARNDEGTVTHYVSTFLDISNIKENQERLEQLAHFDPLTGAANRMLFNDRLREAIRRAHRGQHKMGLYFIDLDGFKPINDQLGHETGDEILIKFTRLMEEIVREDDTIARLGGDEFCIITNDINTMEQIVHLAERFTRKLTTVVNTDNQSLTVTASIGISCYPEHGESPEELLRKADQAMYIAKKNGKARYQLYDVSIGQA